MIGIARRVTLVFLTAALCATLSIAEADQISCGEDFSLKREIVREIWKEALRAANIEAKIIRIPEDAKHPPITCEAEPPKGSEKNLAGIRYFTDSRGYFLPEGERKIVLYGNAFKKGISNFQYALLAQEFFHEFFFLQEGKYSIPAMHHCLMLSRGTLGEILSLIEQRFGLGLGAVQKVLDYTKEQCDEDLEHYKKRLH